MENMGYYTRVLQGDPEVMAQLNANERPYGPTPAQVQGRLDGGFGSPDGLTQAQVQGRLDGSAKGGFGRPDGQTPAQVAFSSKEAAYP